MAISIKHSPPRSEVRSIRAGKHNYIVFRFWDKRNWEYHVYAEVVGKKAAREVAKEFNVKLPPAKPKTKNMRQLWDKIWKEKLTINP
jgi:hypothetical protein